MQLGTLKIKVLEKYYNERDDKAKENKLLGM